MTLTDRTNPLETIEASLNEYRDLKAGWSDGGGEGTSPELIDCLINLCRKFYPADLPAPVIYATIDGGFEFDWRLDDVNIHLAVEDDPSLAEILIFDKMKARRLNADKTVKKIDTNSCFTRIKADITTPEGWDTLNKTVSKYCATSLDTISNIEEMPPNQKI